MSAKAIIRYKYIIIISIISTIVNFIIFKILSFILDIKLHSELVNLIYKLTDLYEVPLIT